MQVHIFTHEGFYSSALLRLLEKYTDLEGHLFVFRRKQLSGEEYSEKIKSRIKYSTGFVSLIREVLPILRKENWIYFHYLPYGPSLFLWAVSTRILKKSTWVIWGGDVFVYKERKKNLRARVYEMLRKIVIPRFPEIAAFLEEDAREAMAVYQSEAAYVPILYPNPLDKRLLRYRPEREADGVVRILVGNSADPSNEHIEVFEKLKHYKKENIKIICPIPVNEEGKYIQTVIETGRAYFGGNFVFQTRWMKPAEYAEFLLSIDIAIMNHRRQQGLGNILALLLTGKKVYLRSDISTYRYLQKEGCEIYDVKTIKVDSFNEFVQMNEESKRLNRQIIDRLTSEEYMASLWLNLLNKHSL